MNISIKKNRIFVVISTVLVVAITTLTFHHTQHYYRNSALGKRYFNKGCYLKALPYLQAAYKSRPASLEAGQYLVWAYDRLGRKNEALGTLEALSKTYPEDFGARRLLADLHYGVGDYTEAEKHYRHALMIKSNLTVQRKLAEVLAWQKKYTQSATILEQLHNKNPQNGQITEFLADVYYWSDNYAEAIQLYNELWLSSEVDKKRATNLGYAYLKTGQPNKSLEVFRNLIENSPDDVKLRLAIVNVLQASGNVNEAEQELKKVIARQPQDTDAKLKLAEILAAKQRYEQAIEICKQILQKDPNHRTAELWLARVLSWSKRYDESLVIYTDIIDAHPEWVEPRREKARVLGWARKYKESIQEYQKTLEQESSNEAIRYEMYSKYNLYNLFDITAIKYYNKWLQLEPRDLEALYDLGQVYSRQEQWTNAKNAYERTLEVFPGHFRAKQALEKVDIYSRLMQLKAGFEFFEADSIGRTVDKRYWNVSASVSKPLSENYYLRLRQDNTWYNFKDFSQIYQQRFKVDLDYYKKPEFWANVNYAHGIYPEEKGLRHTFGGQLNYVPKDPWIINFSHQREQIIDNSVTFRDSLYRDNYKIRGNYRPERRISAALDYTHSRYSDDNSRDAYGLDLGYFISFEPKSLKVFYRYEEYQFDREDADYFSPDSFHCNKIAMEWRHFLNKEELFWGANDTYYTLRYEINFDAKQENGHKLSIDFHHDWNNNCSSHLEWSKTIYEHSDTYSENRLMFYTSIYF